MSDPLVNERPGDLSALGLSSRNDLEPFEVTADREEQDQAVEAAGEPQETPPETPAVEVPAEESEEPEESLLAQYYKETAPEQTEESEITRLRQENARHRANEEKRISDLEEQLKSATAPPTAVENQPTSPLDSPVVRATLDSLRNDEDPTRYEAALVELAKQEAMRELSVPLEELRSQFTNKEQSDKLETQKTAWQRITVKAFEDARAQGGLAADIVADLEQNGNSSLLGKKIAENQYILASRQGIMGAVAEVEAELRARKGVQQSEPGQVSPRGSVNTVGGKSSKRGVSLDEKPQEMTYEEQTIEAIMNSGDRAKKGLSFMR